MSSNLKVFALGGLHEVGKNCYVLEKNEDIIIVDCGIKFLNGSNLADGTIPNFSYLLENQKKIKALFVTINSYYSYLWLGIFHFAPKTKIMQRGKRKNYYFS